MNETNTSVKRGSEEWSALCEIANMNTTKAGTGEGNAPRVWPAGLGRGSNPKSRANLKGEPKNAFVLHLGTDGVWHKLAGPFRWSYAWKKAQDLEARNATERKPLFLCSTYNPNDDLESAAIAKAEQH